MIGASLTTGTHRRSPSKIALAGMYPTIHGTKVWTRRSSTTDATGETRARILSAPPPRDAGGLAAQRQCEVLVLTRAKPRAEG